MTDMFEVWSLPWHALQRNLAKRIGSAAAANAATGFRRAGQRAVAAPGSSWLARALNDAPPHTAFQAHR